MKKTIALLLLVLPLFSIAQISFEPGYFIENGTKTECLIKNLAWKNNPTSIEYKLGENEETKIKAIREISEFNVNNTYKYIRFIVNIDRSETLLNRLSTKKEPEWNKETLLLKVLVEGKITLYQYEENNLVRYFFSTGDNTQAEQLVYKEYEANGYVLKNNAFRQQLYNLMQDVNPDMKKYENISYKQGALVKFFTEYNSSNGQKTVNLTEKHNKARINIRLTPGVTFTSLFLNNIVPDRNHDFATKTGFRIGVEIEYVLPFNNNKWSVFTDPNYQSYINDVTNSDKELTFEVDYKLLQIPLGVRHSMYLNKKSKVLIDAAYTINVALGDSKVFYKQYNDSNSNTLTISNISTFSAGVGFAYNRYSIAARYTSMNLLNEYPTWDSKYNSISIILGYKLF